MQLPKSFEALIATASKEELFQALITQLNKDCALANIDAVFSKDIQPNLLQLQLAQLLKGLMETDFNRYLSFLYVLDVSEQKMKQIKVVDTELLSLEVAFLVLQRVWQKVWFKKQWSS